MEKEKGNFYHFMWTMSESSKSGEKGGRRGLGRNVFCLASYYRSFFALTKRLERYDFAKLSELKIGEITPI